MLRGPIRAPPKQVHTHSVAWEAGSTWMDTGLWVVLLRLHLGVATSQALSTQPSLWVDQSRHPHGSGQGAPCPLGCFCFPPLD